MQHTERELAKSAFDFLIKNNPLFERWSQPKYFHKLMNFWRLKGDRAIIALAGCYVWVHSNYNVFGSNGDTDEERREDAISELQITFAHDLNGATDEHLLPRSDDYGKHWVHAEKIASRA